jgi:hypothetical protein
LAGKVDVNMIDRAVADTFRAALMMLLHLIATRIY